MCPLLDQRFLDENSLESLLESHPELIALDEIDSSASILVPIGRQVTLAGQVLDLLFVDASGKLTAVEAKLERNAEVRRQVVAQVLEYGAYLSEWNLDAFERQAARYLNDPRTPPRFRGSSVYDLLELADEAVGGREQELKDRITSHLALSRMRLIVAVDHIVDPLRRLVSFINQASLFELYLLEVQQFQARDGIRLASVSLFGGTPKVQTIGSTTGPRTAWNEDRFLAALEELPNDRGRTAVRQLLAFTQDHADYVSWGKGTQEGTAGFGLRGVSSQFTLFWATTKGNVWLNGSKINEVIPEGKRRQLYNCLQGAGVGLEQGVIDNGRWPSFDASFLLESRFREFSDVMLSAVSQ